MFQVLRIKNLALIDDLTWELAPGFNILTGETGAGKSILIDAITLLLGERADKSLIRTGADQCVVEGEASLEKESLKRVSAYLDECGVEPCADGQLLLKRNLTSAGSGRAFINGSPVALATLKKLGDLLVDVHGPHDHQSLLSVETQLSLLDAYGKLDKPKAVVASLYEECQQLAKTRDALQMSEREREDRIQVLQHRVTEIQSAALHPLEDETVERDYQIASHARQLLEYSGQLVQLLSESESSVLTQLAQAERTLNAWEKLDPGIHDTAALNKNAIVQVQELVAAVESTADRIDLDGGRLHQLEERLNKIQTLKRKYGPSLEDVIRAGEESAAQLRALESHDAELARLDKAVAQAAASLNKAVEALSKARKEVASPLAERIQKELRGLGFSKAVFRIDLETVAPGKTGADRAEFIFAPNVGEAPRPLRAIASSGEMARVMLAIKTTLASVDEVPILIFDEVDANVGGETASQVGKKLRGLGESHQVLCITHLPQVAAQGGAHFSVEKEVKAGRTSTRLTELTGADREKEIARMLGSQSQQSIALAKTLLKG